MPPDLEARTFHWSLSYFSDSILMCFKQLYDKVQKIQQVFLDLCIFVLAKA